MFPLEPTRIETLVSGLREVLVIEEKAPVVERQLRDMLYNRSGQRPVVIGKQDRDGEPLLSALGELRPSRIMPAFAQWLAAHQPSLDRRAHVIDFTAPE
ncbi:hypothetical protein RZS08_64215, partial [Arthrospira platensis SPKY1]|nr:hypothetical protein [Arthrospira platensis SPKY1]